MRRHPIVRTMITVVVLTGLGAALASPASATEDAPAGNNGTIKVDDVLLDDGNENVPHPGCTFVIDFFGYDVGTRSATMTFDGQEPTGGGELLVDSFTFDVATRDGGNQLDASRQIDLSDALVGIAPQAQQGWHVKLTVHVDGAQGADVKHKVFWVSECEAPALVAAQLVVDQAAATAEVMAWTAAEQSFLAAQASAAQAAAARAAAAQAAAAQASAADATAASLPRTGSSTAPLAGAGIALVAGGALVLQLRKRHLLARS